MATTGEITSPSHEVIINPKCEEDAVDPSAHATASTKKASKNRQGKKLTTMDRAGIREFVADEKYAHTLQSVPHRIAIFSQVAGFARSFQDQKKTDILPCFWHIDGDAWLDCPVNLQSIAERSKDESSLKFSTDVYDYAKVGEGALIVDFANRHVGGGCFKTGWVQEEQMVAQSTDLATFLYKNGSIELGDSEVLSLEGAYMDAHWSRAAASLKDTSLELKDIMPACRGPYTILAVDAPNLGGSFGKVFNYNRSKLHMLAKKVLLIFSAAAELHSTSIIGGLLGGGAFCNNRPLVLLLHLLLHNGKVPLHFHHPVFWSGSGKSREELEQEVLRRADEMLDVLRQRGVKKLREVLQLLEACDVPTNQMDADLHGPCPLVEAELHAIIQENLQLRQRQALLEERCELDRAEQRRHNQQQQASLEELHFERAEWQAASKRLQAEWHAVIEDNLQLRQRQAHLEEQCERERAEQHRQNEQQQAELRAVIEDNLQLRQRQAQLEEQCERDRAKQRRHYEQQQVQLREAMVLLQKQGQALRLLQSREQEEAPSAGENDSDTDSETFFEIKSP